MTQAAAAHPATPGPQQADPVNNFYAHAEALGYYISGTLSCLGASAQTTAIAASHVISFALRDLASKDPNTARAITDELARGIVAFSESLDALEDADGAEEK